MENGTTKAKLPWLLAHIANKPLGVESMECLSSSSKQTRGVHLVVVDNPIPAIWSLNMIAEYVMHALACCRLGCAVGSIAIHANVML